RVKALPDRMAVEDAAPLREFGRLCLADGACAQAARYLEACSTIAQHIGIRVLELVTQRYPAERDLLEGRPEIAQARLSPLLDRRDVQEHVVTTSVLPVLAWAHLELGDPEQAARVAAAAVTRARSGDYRLALVGALRVQAMVALRQGHWEEAA